MSIEKVKINNIKNDVIEEISKYICSSSIKIDVSKFIKEYNGNPKIISDILSNVNSLSANTYKSLFSRSANIINANAETIIKNLMSNSSSQSYHSYYNSGYKNKHAIFKQTIKMVSNSKKFDTVRTGLRKGLLNNYSKIHSSCKQDAFKKLMYWSKTPEEKIQVLNIFKGYIGIPALMKEVGALPASADISKITGAKSPGARVFSFKKADAKDHKKRVQLIKDISKQENSISYLKHNVNVSKEDIKAMPPMSRFNFLKWYYEDHFVVAKVMHFSSVSSLKSQINSRKKGHGKDKIKLSKELSYEEIEGMLFSAVIKKNSETTKFLNNLKKYTKLFDKNVVFVTKGYWK